MSLIQTFISINGIVTDKLWIIIGFYSTITLFYPVENDAFIRFLYLKTKIFYHFVLEFLLCQKRIHPDRQECSWHKVFFFQILKSRQAYIQPVNPSATQKKKRLIFWKQDSIWASKTMGSWLNAMFLSITGWRLRMHKMWLFNLFEISRFGKENMTNFRKYMTCVSSQYLWVSKYTKLVNRIFILLNWMLSISNQFWADDAY